jgi:riboflavin kinase/FMN adenylyltransferase
MSQPTSGNLERSSSHLEKLMVEHFWFLYNIYLKDAWVTIGTFDGVHLGHQAILRGLQAGARAANAPAVVLTFHPHPAVVFGKRTNASSLTTPEERVSVLGDLGIDVVITYPFNMQTAGTTADEFVALLKEHLGFAWLGIGEDFALGKGRQGDADYLRGLGKQFGYHLQVFTPVEVMGELVSSSRIRSEISIGNVKTAARFLGRYYRLSGQVVQGDGRGRSIGIPTANLSVSDEKLIPASGVYACLVRVGDNMLAAAVNIGSRPTFDSNQGTSWVEAHLLDFSGDLYGQIIHLDFVERLRSEQRFAGVKELIEQIHHDIENTRTIVLV